MRGAGRERFGTACNGLNTALVAEMGKDAVLQALTPTTRAAFTGAAKLPLRLERVLRHLRYVPDCALGPTL